MKTIEQLRAMQHVTSNALWNYILMYSDHHTIKEQREKLLGILHWKIEQHMHAMTDTQEHPDYKFGK